MYDMPHAGVDAARTTSIFTTAWAVYTDVITGYGGVLLTTLGLIYAVYNLWARNKEHKAYMARNMGGYDVYPGL